MIPTCWFRCRLFSALLPFHSITHCSNSRSFPWACLTFTLSARFNDLSIHCHALSTTNNNPAPNSMPTVMPSFDNHNPDTTSTCPDHVHAHSQPNPPYQYPLDNSANVPASPAAIRKSIRLVHEPTYLKDFHCILLTQFKPLIPSPALYPISNYISCNTVPTSHKIFALNTMNHNLTIKQFNIHTDRLLWKKN